MTYTTPRARRSPRLPRQREERTDEARPRQSASSASSFPPPTIHTQIPPPLDSLFIPGLGPRAVAARVPSAGMGRKWRSAPANRPAHASTAQQTTRHRPRSPNNQTTNQRPANKATTTARQPTATAKPQSTTTYNKAAGRDLSQQLKLRNNRQASHQPPQKEASQTAARQQSSSDNNQPAQKPASQAEAAANIK